MTTTAAPATTRESTSGELDHRRLPLRLLRHWWAGWGDLVLLVTNVVTGSIALMVTLYLAMSIVLIPGALVGLAMVVPGLFVASALGTAERHRIGALSGRLVEPPLVPTEQPWWKRCWFDLQSWRSAAYLAVHSLWGLITGILTVVLLAQALLLVALPIVDDLVTLDDVRVLWFLPIGTDDGPWLGAALGVAFLALTPLLARAIASVDVMLARWLLGADQRAEVQELSARVDTLTESRQLTVDSVEAERRRIERDLHDGPQQRLVSIAMSLGMARDALEHDPAAARELLDEAHASAKEAIVEMRQVARGIVPPILSDRGLDAALSALADRAPLPVDVTVREVDRVDPTIEAIAYFVVSEALTNVAKHAGATRAQVEVRRVEPQPDARTDGDTPHLLVTVTDDGRGGADPTRGSGLVGLRQRVAAVDGRLDVSSPAGGPTTLHATLPLRTGRTAR